MKYALVDGIKTEATPKAQGKCLCCGVEVIAKCGEKRAWHWAHKNNEECNYSKKDAKTPWHENWQKQFPPDWCEVRCPEDKPIHIADIKTPDELVVEFQHSHISAEDRLAREKFHKNMIWVVDGCRNKNDYKRFVKNFHKLSRLNKKDQEIPFSLYKAFQTDEILPSTWSEITVPIYFDFSNIKEKDKKMDFHESIWGFYLREKQITVIEMNFDDFVRVIKKDAIQYFPNAISSILNDKKF